MKKSGCVHIENTQKLPNVAEKPRYDTETAKTKLNRETERLSSHQLSLARNANLWARTWFKTGKSQHTKQAAELATKDLIQRNELS